MKNKRLGTGVSFKMQHLSEIQANPSKIDWFELLTEHFLVPTQKTSYVLDRLKNSYPLVLHGVTLGIGNSLPLDFDYLSKVKKLADDIDAPWVSDHICWGQVPGAHFHELLPLPFKKNVADYVIERARIVQDFLERPFALENVSTYVESPENEMKEWDFCSYIISESQTHMILDVNNIYVTSHNHKYDPQDYLKQLPWDRIIEIHLAGHTPQDNLLLDTHNQTIIDNVWELYRQAWQLAGKPATLIEYDGLNQTFEDICHEIERSKAYQEEDLYAGTARSH